MNPKELPKDKPGHTACGLSHNAISAVTWDSSGIPYALESYIMALIACYH